ncbi:MAG: hypothetical protein LV471_06120 [Nitrosomonas sp.]|nr:hypothetical protein [Nitrosomonas sp.]
MGFIARRFLILAALQFVVITRYYASSRLAGNKNQRTLNPIQPRFLGSKFAATASLAGRRQNE